MESRGTDSKDVLLLFFSNKEYEAQPEKSPDFF